MLYSIRKSSYLPAARCATEAIWSAAWPAPSSRRHSSRSPSSPSSSHRTSECSQTSTTSSTTLHLYPSAGTQPSHSSHSAVARPHWNLTPSSHAARPVRMYSSPSERTQSTSQYQQRWESHARWSKMRCSVWRSFSLDLWNHPSTTSLWSRGQHTTSLDSHWTHAPY
jgi:hypothetical protein